MVVRLHIVDAMLWQMVSHLLSVCRCYSHVADGIATFWVDLFQFKLWHVKQNLIPYVRQMVFAYVLVEGWIVHPYVYCFFDSSDQVLVLPPCNAEVLNGGIMTNDAKMVIYWEGGLQVFSQPLSKSSWWLPYIFIITVYPVAFVSVDDATFLCDRIFMFRSHQEAFEGITSLVMYLYPMFSAYIFFFCFYSWSNFLFLERLEPSSALKIIQNRMRNIHVQRKTNIL